MAKRGGYISTGERVRSFLLYAFIISIIAHLAIGSVMPNFTKHSEQQGPEQVTVQKRRVVVHTPPPPTPKAYREQSKKKKDIM